MDGRIRRIADCADAQVVNGTAETWRGWIEALNDDTDAAAAITCVVERSTAERCAGTKSARGDREVMQQVASSIDNRDPELIGGL